MKCVVAVSFFALSVFASSAALAGPESADGPPLTLFDVQQGPCKPYFESCMNTKPVTREQAGEARNAALIRCIKTNGSSNSACIRHVAQYKELIVRHNKNKPSGQSQ